MSVMSYVDTKIKNGSYMSVMSYVDTKIKKG